MSLMSSSNSGGLVEIICEFFEIIIHNILFIRKLYPESIFTKRKKYGIVLHQSVHPYLNEYIASSLRALRFHLKAKQLRKVFISLGDNQTTLERYVFDILNLNDLESDPFCLKLEQHLRSLCLKLTTSTSYLKTLPEGTTFTIQLLVSEYSSIDFNDNPLFEDFPWIQVNASSVDLNCANIVPLYTAETESLAIQTYIETFASAN